MHHSEELNPENNRAIDAGEEKREYKIGPGKRVVMTKNCLHCGSPYFPRNKRQKYCSDSCRVMGCYKRNGYKYKSGRYEKENEFNLEPLKLDRTNQSFLPEAPQPKGFDWDNFKESAAASASVEATKYLLHDRPLMKKIDKLLEMVDSSKLQNGIQYLGIHLRDGKAVSLFRDKQGCVLKNEADGKWFRMVSRNPPKWEQVRSPFR